MNISRVHICILKRKAGAGGRVPGVDLGERVRPPPRAPPLQGFAFRVWGAGFRILGHVYIYTYIHTNIYIYIHIYII